MSPIADEIAAVLPSTAPWATGPTFVGAIRSYSWAEAQLALVREFLDEHGILDHEGKPRPAMQLLDRLEGRAAALRAELGLTPMALAKLLGSLVSTAATAGDDDALEQLRAEGARILAARGIGAGGAS